MAKTKPSRTPAQLVGLLESRGLLIPCRTKAEEFLGSVNYYKLKAYLRFFESGCPIEGHAFTNPTSFDDVLRLYRFDRKLRLLISDMLERFEVAVRTRWALELSQITGDPQAHENATNFADIQAHEVGISQLETDYQRSKETFAEHHRAYYPRLRTPPIWVSVELLSFGQVSRWLYNTKRAAVRQEVSEHFQLPDRFFVGFVKQASIVRNSCSHHSRVWNKAITFRPRAPQNSYVEKIGLNTDPAQLDQISTSSSL